MYCAKGDEPKYHDRREPLVHDIEPEDGMRSGRRIVCSLRNHPLVVKGFTHISGWIDWRRQWDEAQTYEQLLGLLHVGLKSQRHYCNWEDPILFYLAIADGWKDGYSSYASEKTALNELKVKAWKTLVMHHWKLDQDDRYRIDRIWDEFLKVPLVDAVLDFFLTPDNLPRSVSDVSENRVAYTFVEWFAEMLWRRSTTDELRQLMADQSRRNKVMRLHVKMEKHSQLLKPSGGLTRVDRRFLKKLALAGTEPRKTLWWVAAGIGDHGKSGDAAIARLLINDFVRRRELARIERVERVERKKKQEEDRQEAIAQAVAAAAAATQRLRELTGNSEK
jgi:hypothetical protein